MLALTLVGAEVLERATSSCLGHPIPAALSTGSRASLLRRDRRRRCSKPPPADEAPLQDALRVPHPRNIGKGPQAWNAIVESATCCVTANDIGRLRTEQVPLSAHTRRDNRPCG